VNLRDREGLIARIRHVRRLAATRDAAPAAGAGEEVSELDALETRVAHLERLLEGLQDSVHRESLRHDDRVNDLEARIQPAALVAALSKDARERGL
jgi:hypothetical protein